MALVLKHATKAQLVERLRKRFRNAEREEVWRLAAKLKGWYDAGDVTAAQLRSAFNMTAGEFGTFAGKLATWAEKWAELQAAKGE
jgi:hypothetical protein